MDKRDWDFSTGTWNLSTKRFKNDSSSSNSVTDAPIDDTTSRSTSSPPGWTGSSSGWKPEHEKSFQSGISPNCGNPLDQNFTPRFSGMNLGDVMKITVMKEMEKLNMTKDKPLDLSKKS